MTAGAQYRALAAILRTLPAELSGCVVTPERVVVFRGLSSPDQIFHRRTGTCVSWSSDPRDLLGGRLPDFDRESLWRSCRGEDVFLYPGLGLLRPGQFTALGPRSTQTETYERATPLELPRRTTLREYARLTYDLLLEETRPCAGGRIGILLSGGVDSATVLAALAEHGADVTAYHMGTDDPSADESSYARQVCRHLAVPLVTVPRATDDDYFSTTCDFPHPFNHVWPRSLERVADRIAADGVRVVLSGLEGDTLFGPLRYGLHDILAGDIPLYEKWRMLRGLLGTRWELSRILRSARPSYSLYADPEALAEVELGSDFLVPVPDAAPEPYDLDFAPQEHTLNLALWRPRGIHLAKPLGGRPLRRLAARLPDVYRLIPHAGRTIDKPVLRLAAAHRLPPDIWRHYGRTWLGSPDETWCLRHPEALARILGAPDARLTELGVVDPRRLDEVLTDPGALRRNAENLLCSAMVELFLRDLEARLGRRPRMPTAADDRR
ncbi:asparagine synthase-related protein [Streptomyces sp. DG2A-72]|uniref:asparagine synthase-related protein n=1 Tax=Streptomyces sp. DG2A-72 TaxID=3051386 RepID=UPI00265C352B|nr:asparagine synthase-related protein [Streptomyces sp. DG2A-72]MDO0934961.1 asparagine synthase-related protein [Streptomyces sp. DG2A-72]